MLFSWNIQYTLCTVSVINARTSLILLVFFFYLNIIHLFLSRWAWHESSVSVVCLHHIFVESLLFPKEKHMIWSRFWCSCLRIKFTVQSRRQTQRQLAEAIWLLFYWVHKLLPWKTYLGFMVSNEFVLFSHLIQLITY